MTSDDYARQDLTNIKQAVIARLHYAQYIGTAKIGIPVPNIFSARLYQYKTRGQMKSSLV